MGDTGNLFYQTLSDPGGIAGGSLIFIHGAGGSHLKWAKLMGKSLKGFTQLAVDLMGHGSSPGSPVEEVLAYATSIKEFLDTKGFPRPWVLAGHSMGGSIALQAALSYPDTVDGLILIGSGAKMPVNPTMLEQLAQGSFDTAFLKIAYGRNIDPEVLSAELDNWSQVSQHQLYLDFKACNNYDVANQLGKIDIPVLILVGDQDKMTPVKSSQYLQENIKGSVIQIIPGAGHHLMLEKPDETISAISSFLAENF